MDQLRRIGIISGCATWCFASTEADVAFWLGQKCSLSGSQKFCEEFPSLDYLHSFSHSAVSERDSAIALHSSICNTIRSQVTCMPSEMKNSLCTTRGFTSFNTYSEMQNHSFSQHLDMSYKRKRITARRIPFIGCFRRIDGTGVWSTALLNLHVAAM